MARTPAQRGRIGNWLVESRLARSWATQDKARAEIERLTGWRIPQSVYAEWESGRRLPADGNLARLQEFYGDTPQTGAAAADTGAVLEAVRELVGEIRAERQARQEWEQTFVEAIRELVLAAKQPAEPERDSHAEAPR